MSAKNDYIYTMEKSKITLKSSRKKGKSVTRAKAREAIIFAKDAVQKNKSAVPKVKVIISPAKTA